MDEQRHEREIEYKKEKDDQDKSLRFKWYGHKG